MQISRTESLWIAVIALGILPVVSTQAIAQSSGAASGTPQAAACAVESQLSRQELVDRQHELDQLLLQLQIADQQRQQRVNEEMVNRSILLQMEQQREADLRIHDAPGPAETTPQAMQQSMQQSAQQAAQQAQP